MPRRAAHLLAWSAVALASAAEAGETVTYSYDALGRLTATASSGTVNNGVATGIAYDPAGNRSAYNVTGAGGAPTPAPPPPPPGPPPPPPAGNQPPTASPDSATVMACIPAYISVLANDTDPEGNIPLALLAVTQGTKGTASLVRSEVRYTPGNQTGTDALTYTVRDSLGASSTGTVAITITMGQC